MALIADGTVNAGTDTDKILVLDATDNVDYRTGDELLDDIGGAITRYGGLETFPIACATGQEITAWDGAGQIWVAVINPFNTTITKMSCLVTQTAGAGWMKMGIADSTGALIEETEPMECAGADPAKRPDSLGIKTLDLDDMVGMARNTIYYMVIGGTCNGIGVVSLVGYACNSPYLCYYDNNPVFPGGTDLKAGWSGGSQDTKMIWMLGLEE